DSIPFDLGVYFLQKEVIARHGQPASIVRGRVRAMNGEFSGGTAASLGATMASLKEKPELFEILVNPFALSNGFTGPEQAQDSKPIYDDKLETWVAPFFMAPINTKNVHRSNALMDHLYGKDFCYNEMWIQGPGEEGKAAAEFVGSMNPLADAPAPGEGPSKESRENGNYDVLFCADLSDESSLHASVSGDMDPGYGSTSKMIAESALCLVNDCAKLGGGIYTPAPAMGEKLIIRLQANAGLTFKIEN
ncbi:MAG: saccharopine dehydrogenase, partial [Paracoccaceae bacterium]